MCRQLGPSWSLAPPPSPPGLRTPERGSSSTPGAWPAPLPASSSGCGSPAWPAAAGAHDERRVAPGGRALSFASASLRLSTVGPARLAGMPGILGRCRFPPARPSPLLLLHRMQRFCLQRANLGCRESVGTIEAVRSNQKRQQVPSSGSRHECSTKIILIRKRC